jgi:hypothetical protein
LEKVYIYADLDLFLWRIQKPFADPNDSPKENVLAVVDYAGIDLSLFSL